MEEVLKIAKNGQWSLVEKQQEAPKIKVDPGETAADEKYYHSYRDKNLQGQLREDHGQKGMLHNTGNNRPPRQTSNDKMNAKVPTPLKGFAQERKPGDGVF